MDNGITVRMRVGDVERAWRVEEPREMTVADLGLDSPWDFWEDYSSYGPYSPAARIWHPKHWKRP